MLIVSDDQFRAARALRGLSQQEVADASGINKNVIARLESPESNSKPETIERLASFYEEIGVEFTDHNGVREGAEVTARVYRGQSGFIDFAKDVYRTVRKEGGHVCVSNVDETNWDKWLGTYRDEYLSGMAALHNFNSRILIRTGDTHKIAANYAEYRHVDPEDFGSVPFYVYGKKVAMILFHEMDCIAVVINNKEIAEAHRTVFERLWQSAHTADGSKN